MDKFDMEILKILQDNNLTPQREIGDHIGLSAAAVQRRVKRMRLEGIIKKDVSVLNASSFNDPITLLVEVFLESEKIELIDETKKIFIETPEVQQCFYVTGESDFFLIIVIASMKEYENLIRRIFFGCENVKSFRTIVTLSNEKQSLEIPFNINQDPA
jgi:Lrp/AsnC family leucine-responsive transcriptional regulator